ncbi:hypothetical protein GCK72_016400 [Caenorhabditis remanei]|uniref:Anaphase-promoting complex subunit 10 n=1 Tax=Caenorhabditis remanei TaxID=31234 RepID=E3MQR6_CAERE|nr:hypothetical protein GCK72_016400 [Caenorhabditis remanei]EFP07088.1 CRE-APC-10 protein [Caenorhabditis remanei]KAF1749855.1 hypothetical protein GCK72_016400 [Caenorhabditis remanei]
MPRLQFVDVESTSSRGWVTAFEEPNLYEDITNRANFALSSVAHCGGVDQLLHDSSELAWRTNMSPPHQAVLTFQGKTDVSYIMLYLDFVKDESYCPQEVRIDLGWGTNDWWHQTNRRVNQPQGWVKIRLLDKRDLPRRVMALRMTVVKNHEKGRDCVIRHFRVIGPKFHHHDAMNRLMLGNTTMLGAVPAEEKDRSRVLNNHLTIR